MIMNATSFEYRAELLAWLICSSGTHGPRRQTPKHDYMAHAVRHRNMVTCPGPRPSIVDIYECPMGHMPPCHVQLLCADYTTVSVGIVIGDRVVPREHAAEDAHALTETCRGGCKAARAAAMDALRSGPLT